MSRYALLTDGRSNPKTAKPLPPWMADAAAEYRREHKAPSGGFLTAVLHLAPASESGRNVCPFSGACKAVCLNTAGRGAMSSVQRARIRRTRMFTENREMFLLTLEEDIQRHEDRARRLGMVPVIRLNGTSDIPWWNVTLPDHPDWNIFQRFPRVQFYDYTKRPVSLWPDSGYSLPPNYCLTFSHDPGNGDGPTLEALSLGRNVTVVFDLPKGAPFPDEWFGRPVVDGYSSDLRFLDPVASVGYVVGLYALGKARHSAFAVAA